MNKNSDSNENRDIESDAKNTDKQVKRMNCGYAMMYENSESSTKDSSQTSVNNKESEASYKADLIKQ